LKSRAATIFLPMNKDGLTLHQLNLTSEYRYPVGGVKVDFSGLREADYLEINPADLI